MYRHHLLLELCWYLLILSVSFMGPLLPHKLLMTHPGTVSHGEVWYEIGQSVVPFTGAVISGSGCPDSGLSLGSESDVTIGSQRCADNGCCVTPA